MSRATRRGGRSTGAAAMILGMAAMALAQAAPRADSIELVRDPWGTPHVFAESDAGAFYALGYATACDRGVQMTYTLRTAQGRLAEVIGDVAQVGSDDTAVDHDRLMRTFGFHRAAQRTAAGLDGETRALLAAYCEGVNAGFAANRETLEPRFARYGLSVEPWTPADCLTSWWYLGQFFATDGTRDLVAGQTRPDLRDPAARGPRGAVPAGPQMPPLPPDDTPAVVQRSDLSRQWLDRYETYVREQGLAAPVGATDGEGPRFSHAWVVGGARTTTGSAVLVSDPQTPVRNPSLFYEFHVQGSTFNARGIGVPGSPALLIGFTDRVAWGLTALGADQADLFHLDTDPEHPDQYRFDGQWRPMTVLHEQIKVRGGDPVAMVVRETHLGPVVTEFCFAGPDDGQFALKRIPLCETNRDTFQGLLGMLRAQNVAEFDEALEGWRFPSANALFGDRDGHIGFRCVGAIPLRSTADASRGRIAQPGHDSAADWRGFVPHDLVPGVQDPAVGFLYTANHRPIGSWYQIPLGTMTGAGGDTVRSWRLRERLGARERFAPEDVLAIHRDAVNPARRELVRLGLHLRDQELRALSEDALAALAVLEGWSRRGASSALDQPGAALALELNLMFRIVSTELAGPYGGGESGLTYFLKTAAARLDGDPASALNAAEARFVDQTLSNAWSSARSRHGDDPATWDQAAREVHARQVLGAYENLSRFPALDPELAITMPALNVTDGGTIACQTAQSYTQFVPMHDPDQALSILPIGASDRPGDPARTATLSLWSRGELHPAPLTRAAVDALGSSQVPLPAWVPR